MPGNFHVVPHAVVESWPKPNFIDPVSRDWLPALACTLLGVSTVLIAGRFYLRIRKAAGEFGLDDLFMLIAWLFSAALSAMGVIDSQWYYIRVHVWDVPVWAYIPGAKTAWVSQVLFLVSTCATKASVLLFYRRITKDSYGKGMLYAIWAALAFTAIYFVAILLTYCTICVPLNAYWLSYSHSYHEKYTCIDGAIWGPFVGTISVVSDIYAVLLPCVWLYRYNLRISKRQRISLNVVFSLGTIVAGCGIARTYYLVKLNHTYDITWYGFDLFVWSLLECHLAIIFACAPSLRAFIRRYLPDTVKGSVRNVVSPNKRRTKDIYEGYWDDRNSSALDGPVIDKKKESVIEERELSPAKPVHLGEAGECEDAFTASERSGSSEMEPTIRNADDYEAYILKRLHRQTRDWKKNANIDRFSVVSTPSVMDHDFDEGRVWPRGSDV